MYLKAGNNINKYVFVFVYSLCYNIYSYMGERMSNKYHNDYVAGLELLVNKLLMPIYLEKCAKENTVAKPISTLIRELEIKKDIPILLQDYKKERSDWKMQKAS